jgi:hypothetical protein
MSRKESIEFSSAGGPFHRSLPRYRQRSARRRVGQASRTAAVEAGVHRRASRSFPLCVSSCRSSGALEFPLRADSDPSLAISVGPLPRPIEASKAAVGNVTARVARFSLATCHR